jgi:unsaturated pyranuronate lyase
MPFIDVADMPTGGPLPGWKGRFWRSENMSFAHYATDAGSLIHEHHHPNEEVWAVIEGQLEVTIDGATQVAGSGRVAVVPSNARHSVKALTEARAIVANHPIRHDFVEMCPVRGVEWAARACLQTETEPLEVECSA